MAHAYSEASERLRETYRRVHANGEQTLVAVISSGDDYVAVAFDIDPRDMVTVAAEPIAYDPTLEGARTRAERWMQDNPKGIADGGSGSNIVVRVLKKINDYGEDLAEQHQDPEKSQ